RQRRALELLERRRECDRPVRSLVGRPGNVRTLAYGERGGPSPRHQARRHTREQRVRGADDVLGRRVERAAGGDGETLADGGERRLRGLAAEGPLLDEIRARPQAGDGGEIVRRHRRYRQLRIRRGRALLEPEDPI